MSSEWNEAIETMRDKAATQRKLAQLGARVLEILREQDPEGRAVWDDNFGPGPGLREIARSLGLLDAKEGVS